MTEIKAVIFDLDGVLTSTAEYHYRAWKQLADELGIAFDRQRNEALRGVSRRRSLELLLNGRPAIERQMQQWMAQKNDTYQALIEELTPDSLLPGARELFQELRQAGIKIGVGSASKNTRAVLDRLELGDILDAVSDGHSVERQKPAPDLFLHAARQLSVDPDEAVVVEDAASGVEAALAGGFWTVGLGPEERVGAAHVVFPSLEGVALGDILAALGDQAAAQPQGAEPTESSNWHIAETSIDPAALHRMETIFTIGNGYLGTRGTFEESYPSGWPATFVHGVFDDAPLVHTELVNVPNWLPFLLFVNGERFRMDRGTIRSYRRDLCLRTGVLTRSLRWRSPADHTIDVTIERFASLADPHLLGIRYQVTALDFEGQLAFRAGLEGHVDNQGWTHWRVADQDVVGQQTAYLQMRTRRSGIELCQACHLTVRGGSDVVYAHRDCEGAPAAVARLSVRRGEPVVADKLVALVTSREVDDVRGVALAQLQSAVRRGYDDLRARNDAAWESEWESCNVTIEGDDRADQALRYGIFQLLIAAPRHDDRVSIPAKTLSGFGYRGHVFWDTEIFMLPFFTFTQPRIARNLLMYRYHTLPGARRKAREHGYEGAMFAWESADSGDETTPRLVPGPEGDLIRIWTGDIQHHITADVAYGVVQYWRVTGDDAFMRDYGAEIVLDTARFWGSRVEWNAARARYEINDVMGPDEYHEHVDNNAFTNHMARWNLETALEILAWLRREHAGKAAELEAHLGLTEERLAHWGDVVGCLYLPHDPETGLLAQFDGFFDLEMVDLGDYEPRTRSMLAELGVEGIQGYQVIKQPDVLMLFHLLGDVYEEGTLRVNWDTYIPRTDLSHGSSLGPSVHAALAARLGESGWAYEQFMHAAKMDLRDLRGNTADGIHAAAGGGAWQAVVFGFVGLEVDAERYRVRPRLPPHWKRVKLSFRHRGERIDLVLSNRDTHEGGDTGA